MTPVRVSPLVPPTEAMPKSTTFTRPPRREHHVFRLQVAVDDAQIVRGRQAARDAQQDLHRLADRQASIVQSRAKRLAGDELRDDEQVAVDVFERVDGGDRFVRELAGRPGLAMQPIARLQIGRQRRRQRLERHPAFEPRVPGAVDDAHAAARQFLIDDVAADTIAVRQPWLVPLVVEGGAGIDGRVEREPGRERRRRADARTSARTAVSSPHAVSSHGRAPMLRELERRLDEVAHARPAQRVHRLGHEPASSPARNARADVQRRFTVAGEMPRASAVSSTLSPPK